MGRAGAVGSGALSLWSKKFGTGGAEGASGCGAGASGELAGYGFGGDGCGFGGWC